MRPCTLGGGLAVLLTSGLAAAQPASVPAPMPGISADDAASAPAPAQAPAPAPNPAAQPEAPPPAAESDAPTVLGDGGPAPGGVPPSRKAPRAHVSIVSPQQSTVHKRRRGIRPQDGGDVADDAAQDAPSGPAVERLE